jgi:tetratricopeptide (TPR) repeat protein
MLTDIQVSETSTELVKHSLSSSTTSTETTTVSDSVYRDVFFSIIGSSKTVEASTIALAKKLTARYMEQHNWSGAINVINATLQRTWTSFLSESIQDVTMTSTFTQESIEMVERLAECYLHTNQLAKVDDTYMRLFKAVSATEFVDKPIFDKSKTHSISFYDKHGYVDSAISLFQEILVAYRTKLGPAHESTIQALYTLARRCQSHPRNHPYWIEYYQQIIAVLNKDSDLCHKDALDAIIVVAETYWQDRRYAEAVNIHRVLWNTYTRKSKEYKVFSDAKFVQKLYEHYFQCLEETKASWKSLYQVTKEHRDTSMTMFGAESTIAVEATLALAQVSQHSEEHLSESITLYEEASRSKTTTTRTTADEVKQALSSLYVRQLQSHSSSSSKAETIQRAISMTQDQLNESTKKYGYSHESSLNRLKELAMLHHRQQKTDVAVKLLTTAASEVMTKETSSRKQIEAASSLANSFQHIQQTSTAHDFLNELHRQIIAKDARYASKWSFDLTKASRSALAFLASLKYNLREDTSVTFSEIMSDLMMEYIYFEQFSKALQNNESLVNILLAAAPLRSFLQHHKREDMVKIVEEQAVGIFVKRDASDLNPLSKESPRIFLVRILDYLGNGKNKDFGRSVILASNDSVSKLTKSKQFPEAYDIANLGFMYASKQDGYNGPRSISLGFRLASLLVGSEGEKTSNAALRTKMLQLSNRIVRKIIEISKKLDINFAQVQLYELSELSVLLGEQQDYETLEVSYSLIITCEHRTDNKQSGCSKHSGPLVRLKVPGPQPCSSTSDAVLYAPAISLATLSKQSDSAKTLPTTCGVPTVHAPPSPSRLTSCLPSYTPAPHKHIKRKPRLRRQARLHRSTLRKLSLCTRTLYVLWRMSTAPKALAATTQTTNSILLLICSLRRVSKSPVNKKATATISPTKRASTGPLLRFAISVS